MSFKKLHKSVPAIAIILVFSFTHFQKSNAQNVKVIKSVEEAVSLALKNNPDVITAHLDILKAKEKVSEVYSDNLIPTLSLESRYTRNFYKQTFFISGEKFEIGSDNIVTNALDLRQALPILGTPVFNGIRIAQYYEQIQLEGLELAENEVRTNVRKAYYAVLLAKAVVDVNELTLENAKYNFSVVESKYRNGIATEFDYLRAKVKVENVEPVLSKSIRNLEISQRFLLNAIGLKTDDVLEVSGELSYDSLEVWESTDLMIQKISENYVSVRQLEVNRKINKELVDVDKANYLPKVFIFGRYDLSSQENDEQPVYNYRFYNTLNLGLGLSWDLNLFRNSYKVNQSEIEVKKTDEQISALKQKLKLLAQSALIALEDAKERIISQKKTVSIAERGVELANTSYKEGVLNQIDVQDAVLTLSQSQLAYLNAIYDFQVAKAEVEKLLEK